MKLIFPLWVISFSLVFSAKWLNLTSFSKTENVTIVNVWLGWKGDALTVPEANVYYQYCSADTVSAELVVSAIKSTLCTLKNSVPCVQTRSKNRQW